MTQTSLTLSHYVCRPGVGGGSVRLVSIVVQGGGVGWDVVCERSSKAEEECSCSAAAEESGRAVFWRAGSRVLIPHLCHHPQPDSS